MSTTLILKTYYNGNSKFLNSIFGYKLLPTLLVSIENVPSKFDTLSIYNYYWP